MKNKLKIEIEKNKISINRIIDSVQILWNKK